MENENIRWMDRGGIDEVNFCRSFLLEHPMVYVDGAFFTAEGRVADEQLLRKQIYDAICDYVTTNMARKVDSILSAMRIEAHRESLEHSVGRIQVANGIFVIGEGFVPRKEICRYRLPVGYNEDAPKPVLWLKFLDELLEPEDILTLQEFMGYCLIPTTVAQKMLLIIGRGGEGKSRIGIVMRALLGDNMVCGSLAKVENSPFARADLEHQLLMVDDDLKLEALGQTNYIKSIVTSEQPMDLERKGIQSYQGLIVARFMAFGNGTLQALHDRSYGFFRRQIILTTKERPADRVDDPYLGIRLVKEKEGIFLWALEGLYRLFDQDFRFTISSRAKENLHHSIVQGNNVVEFMESKGYFRFDPMSSASSRAFYNVYRDWCEDNIMTPLSPRSFSNYLCQNLQRYHLERSNSVPIGNGRYARGYQGIALYPRV